MSKKVFNQGFTLVEILVVMAVIAILAGVILRGVLGSTDKAKAGRAKSEIGQIAGIIQQIEVDTGCWPKASAEAVCKTPYVVEEGVSDNEIWDLNDLAVGIVGDSDGVFPSWQGPYMTIVHNDPWGNLYFFDTDYDIDPSAGENWAAVLGSFGPNGVQDENDPNGDDVIKLLAD